MSNIPLISHRMFVAAVAQERRLPPPDLPSDLEPASEQHALVEILDPSDWAGPPALQDAQPPFLSADDI